MALDFTAPAPGGGCALDLFVATKANGLSIEGGLSISIRPGPPQELSNRWASLLGPTSFREDHSGITSCEDVR
jgi:hypothetical protein